MGKSYIDGSGNKFQFTNKVGFLAFGTISNHLWASGINVNAPNGLAFWSGKGVGDMKDRKAAINYDASTKQLNIGCSDGIAFNGNKGISKNVTYQTNLADRRIMEFKYGILVSEHGN